MIPFIVVGWFVSNATVGAIQSGLPFGEAIANNLILFFVWPPLPIALGAIAFLGCWGLLQIGLHRAPLTWWRAGLVGAGAAALIVLLQIALNAWVAEIAHVRYYGDGEAREIAAMTLRSSLLVLWSATAGIGTAIVWSCRRRVLKERGSS